MSIEEFSNGFDMLVQSYIVQNRFGDTAMPQQLSFDEYEKSYFLTEAQKAVVKETYSGAINSFESEEKEREALEMLVNTYTQDFSTTPCEEINGLLYFEVPIPDGCWYIVYEHAILEVSDKCLNGKMVDVVPVKYDDLLRTIKNPFRGPAKRRVLRVNAGEGVLNIVSTYNLGSYYMKYVKEPEPILLVKVPEELGFAYCNEVRTSPQTCLLNTAIHSIILNRAVQLAIQSKAVALGGSKSQE